MADLFDIVTARKLSGGGGGGSSDFSTATLTISGLSDMPVYVPYIIDAPNFATTEGFIPVDGTYPVILYKGKAILMDTNNYWMETTGAIESVGGGAYFITGDCTITIS